MTPVEQWLVEPAKNEGELLAKERISNYLKSPPKTKMEPLFCMYRGIACKAVGVGQGGLIRLEAHQRTSFALPEECSNWGKQP